MEERLSAYIKEDAGRWYAVHARISAISDMLWIALLAAGKADPAFRSDFMSGLAALMDQAESPSHPAGQEEYRRIAMILEVEWNGGGPHPTSGTIPENLEPDDI